MRGAFFLTGEEDAAEVGAGAAAAGAGVGDGGAGGWGDYGFLVSEEIGRGVVVVVEGVHVGACW